MGSSTSSLVMIAIMFVVMYVFLVLPQKRRTKSEEAMRSSLEVGDEVITIGGIVGIITSIKENTIVVETGNDKTHIRVLRGSIARSVTAEEKAAEEKASRKK